MLLSLQEFNLEDIMKEEVDAGNVKSRQEKLAEVRELRPHTCSFDVCCLTTLANPANGGTVQSESNVGSSSQFHLQLRVRSDAPRPTV